MAGPAEAGGVRPPGGARGTRFHSHPTCENRTGRHIKNLFGKDLSSPGTLAFRWLTPPRLAGLLRRLVDSARPFSSLRS